MKTLALKTFALLSIVALSLGTLTARAAGEDVNMEDRTDTYVLTDAGRKAGWVTVQSKFVGDPIIMPVEISVKVKCAPGFRARNSARSEVWQAFDYGRPGQASQLSTFDPASDTVVVYYWTAKLDRDQAATHDRAMSRTFNLKTSCVH
jgi:hypothetical protein